jgi:flagellar biosynthesis/type III secretory pathway chaperone
MIISNPLLKKVRKMDYQKNTKSLLQKDLGVLRALLKLCETQKGLIKISNRKQIDGFLSEKKRLVARLADIEKDIERSMRGFRTEEQEAIRERIKEIETLKRKILAVEEEDREIARNELIMIKSVLEGIKKGKHTLKKYKTARNQPARYIDALR